MDGELGPQGQCALAARAKQRYLPPRGRRLCKVGKPVIILNAVYPIIPRPAFKTTSVALNSLVSIINQLLLGLRFLSQLSEQRYLGRISCSSCLPHLLQRPTGWPSPAGPQLTQQPPRRAASHGAEVRSALSTRGNQTLARSLHPGLFLRVAERGPGCGAGE